MNTKKKYIAPTLKRYAYQVENGFANSLILNSTYGNYNNGFERWGWTSGGDNGFNEGNDNEGEGTGWGWDI